MSVRESAARIAGPDQAPPVYADFPVSRDSSDRRKSDEQPKAMRKVRTAHGTRVARAIVCSACGKDDTVPFSPRKSTQVLCRRCAAEYLGVPDEESGIRIERVLTCTECGKEERTSYVGDDPFQCKDCLLGIWTKQQDRTKSAERLGTKGRVLRVRREDGPHDKR